MFDDPATKNVLLSFLFDLVSYEANTLLRRSALSVRLIDPQGPCDKGFVARFTAAKKSEARAANDVKVAEEKLTELRGREH